MSPGRPDAAVVRRHLVALDEILERLAGHAGRSVESLRSDVDERWAVERGLLLCAQNVLDVATHLVASAGRDARDYTTAIDELGLLGVLPLDLAARLRPLAGFRNALVHGYLGVDVDRVHAALNQHLDEVREFARHVDRFLIASG
jgi:uncharacterized protein YutE (UPF0331/DUF86 family)